MTRALQSMGRWLGDMLAATMPHVMMRACVARMSEHEPESLLEVFGSRVIRERNLDNMPFDLPIQGRLEFENLAGLFASTSLEHGVIGMPIRQAAYLFGLVRQSKASKVIEIGRYKGGSTLVIAAAMDGRGEFWSIDVGEKEARLHPRGNSRPFDEQVADVCKRFGLNVHLLVEDSQTVEVESGEVDLVFIDGDHSYEGVKNDFERFGRKVRLGGAVLFDDAFDEGVFRSHSDTVGRLVQEIASQGGYVLIKAVNRLAHLVRVR